jgi:hypothetical protein
MNDQLGIYGIDDLSSCDIYYWWHIIVWFIILMTYPTVMTNIDDLSCGNA